MCRTNHAYAVRQLKRARTAGACDDDDGIASEQWDFGDGTTGVGREIDHTYGAPGTYDVVLTISIGDPTCTNPSFAMTTASITTDATGNGSANHVFTHADAAGLRGLLLGGVWQLVEGGTPVYATGCQAVQLD